jgi:hypothetical protein
MIILRPDSGATMRRAGRLCRVFVPKQRSQVTVPAPKHVGHGSSKNCFQAIFHASTNATALPIWNTSFHAKSPRGVHPNDHSFTALQEDYGNQVNRLKVLQETTLKKNMHDVCHHMKSPNMSSEACLAKCVDSSKRITESRMAKLHRTTSS